MGTTLAMSSAYHPETDGQTESSNKCMEHYLRCFIANNPRTWVELLPWAELSNNTTFHTNLGMIPFQAANGREPPALISYRVTPNDPILVSDILQQGDKLLHQLKANLAKAQERMRRFAYKN